MESIITAVGKWSPYVLAVVVVLWAIQRRLSRNYDYWQKQKIPFLKPRLILGSVNLIKPLHLSEKASYDKHGRIYGEFDGTMPVLKVGDPGLLRLILVKDFHIFPNHRKIKTKDPVTDKSLFVLEGKDWKRVRTTVSPIFTSAKLRKMMPLMEECSNTVIKKFEELAERNETIIAQHYLCKFSMDVISRCIFGMHISEELENEIVDHVKKTLSCALSWRTFGIIVFPKLMQWLRFSLLNPESTGYLKRFMTSVVQESKMKDRKDLSDLLQRVLEGQKCSLDQNNNGSLCKDSPTSDGQQPQATTGMSTEEGISQCVTFFMAGFDATTSLLSYAVHELAAKEKFQERLLLEIEEVTANNEGTLNYLAISQMKFLDAILCECLRLCPTLVRLERSVEEDYVLGDTGIQLKKGMLISIPVYAMQRDPEWYPDPEVFNPERFLCEELAPPPYTYLPFGYGPRVCLAKRFVEIGVKFFLAKLVKKFKFELADPTKVTLNFNEQRAVLKPESVEIKITSRC